MRTDLALRRIERLRSQAITRGHKGKALVWAAMLERRRGKLDPARADPSSEPQADPAVDASLDGFGAVSALQEPAT